MYIWLFKLLNPLSTLYSCVKFIHHSCHLFLTNDFTLDSVYAEPLLYTCSECNWQEKEEKNHVVLVRFCAHTHTHTVSNKMWVCWRPPAWAGGVGACAPVLRSVLTEQQGRQMGGGSGYPQYSLSSSNRTTSNPEHHFHPLARTHNMAMHSLTRWFQTHIQYNSTSSYSFSRSEAGQREVKINAVFHA